MTHADTKLEGSVIGALLDADGQSWHATAAQLIEATGLSADDFTDGRHRSAFGAIRALADRGRPTDAQAVAAVQSDLSASALTALQAGNSILTLPTLRACAEDLRRLTLLRRLEAHHKAQLAALGKSSADPAKLAAAAEAFCRDFAGTVEGDETGDVDVYELSEAWDAFAQGKREPYLRTGLEVLDEHFNGFVANLNVIGGKASMGKTALIAQMLWGWLEKGLRVGLFGLEDGTGWLVERHMSRALGLPVGLMAACGLHPHQQETYAQKSNDWADMLRRQLCVYRRAGLGASNMLAIAKRWIHVKGVQAIVIDHGGEVRHESVASKERYDLAVGETYRSLRDLAVNTKTPVIVLHHLNRESAKGGQPTMEGFRETGLIENMARTALGLWEREQNAGQLLVTVLKATKGKRDVTVALNRDVEHALVHAQGGFFVDLQGEAEAERLARSNTSTRKRVNLFAGGNL